jgi:hypothetical protein
MPRPLCEVIKTTGHLQALSLGIAHDQASVCRGHHANVRERYLVGGCKLLNRALRVTWRSEE